MAAADAGLARRPEAGASAGGDPPRHGDRKVHALHLLPQTGDPCFALSAAGRIVGWNKAAERLFGYKQGDVLGRPCHEVLACQDLRGQPLSSASCPLSQAVRLAKPVPAVEVLVHHRQGRTVACSANVVIIPAPLGTQALVLLRPFACGIVEDRPDASSWAGDRPSAAIQHGFASERDLASALDHLLLTTGADAAELFLAAPPDGPLVLAAHSGEAPRAFRQIICFERGQGFPGLVARTGEPLLSLDLAHDDRYLRTRVKEQGFHYYLCVPIWGRSGYVGSLHIASRRRAETVAPHLPFLSHAAQHFGAMLERRRLHAAVSIACQTFDPSADASANLKRTADAALTALIGAAGADCGTILLVDEATGTLQPVSTCDLPLRLRRRLTRGCRLSACPVIAQRRCVVLSPATEIVAPLCRALLRDLATVLCLPLELAGRSLGVAVLGCRYRAHLPTQHLSFLHAVLSSAAAALHNAQVALCEEREAWLRAARGRAAERTAPEACGHGPEAVGQDGARRAPADAPFLDLRCLGRFAVSSNGRPLPPERFARRRSLTLLKILLTRYGKPVHREELMELLWPETDPDSARSLLNVAVHYLRRALEPRGPRGHVSSFIRADGAWYSFDTTSPHRLDSREFLDLARLGPQLEAQGRPAEALAAYQQAIALYGGDFLEDEPYSDWCALEREELRETFLAVLHRAACLQLDGGDIEAALVCYRRALATDATLEEVHRCLMAALWRAGRRDEALRQYGNCRAVLERELGIAPAPETEALRLQIIADGDPCPALVAGGARRGRPHGAG